MRSRAACERTLLGVSQSVVISVCFPVNRLVCAVGKGNIQRGTVWENPPSGATRCAPVSLLAGLAASLGFVLKIHVKRFGWFRNDNRDKQPWCEGDSAAEQGSGVSVKN